MCGCSMSLYKIDVSFNSFGYVKSFEVADFMSFTHFAMLSNDDDDVLY